MYAITNFHALHTMTVTISTIRQFMYTMFKTNNCSTTSQVLLYQTVSTNSFKSDNSSNNELTIYNNYAHSTSI